MPPRGWATVSVREDVRRALEEIASQKGFSSMNDVIAFLLDKYREFTDISVKLADISVKLDKLLQAGGDTTSNQITTQSETETGGSISDSTSGGHEWCRPRSSIRNLGGFIKYVERTYGLEDWWEEGDDEICFKTKTGPAKT